MKTTQSLKARKLGISESHLSNILSGRHPIGKRTAKAIAKLTGRKWNILLAYEPKDLRKILGL